MAKLYALEADDKTQELDPLDKRNQLLIEKVLDYDKKSMPATSVTADLLKQRHDLRKEITQQLDQQKKEEEQEGDGDGDNQDQDPDNSGENTPADEGGDNQPQDDNNTDSDDNDNGDKQPADKAKGGATDDESEESVAADDVDSLRNLVGGKGGKSENKGDDKASTESFHTPRAPKPKPVIMSVVGQMTALRGLFEPLKQSHRRRMVAIEGFQLNASPKVTDQPLAYVKDDVVESLNRLITLSNHYIAKNNSTVAQGAEGLKSLGEQLTAYGQYIEAGKFHFSQQLIQDEELLKPLSVKGKNELAYTSTLLAKYLESSSALAVKLMQNPFEQLPDAFASGGYKDKQGVMVNELMLPGFTQMQASVVPFSNYIDTKYEEYQVYKVQTFKPHDLYSLPAISLEEDKDLKKLMTELDKILISAGLILDNVKDMSAHYQTFIDSLKTISYDVEKGAQTNLAGLGLDDKLKDFIKFKLVTELYINDLDAAVHYLSAAMSALAQLVELSDK